MGLMCIVPIKWRRNGNYEAPGTSRHQCSLSYVLPDGTGNHVQVCRKTFQDTFSITHKQVQVLCERKKNGETAYVEKRGGAHHVKFTETLKNEVRQHIMSFPYEENHYSRKKSTKQFFKP